MKTRSNLFRALRFFLIKVFKGESAYYEAVVGDNCRQVAEALECKSFPGHVAKRKIARHFDVSVEHVGDAARVFSVNPVIRNRTYYYTVEDAAKIVKWFE